MDGDVWVAGVGWRVRRFCASRVIVSVALAERKEACEWRYEIL